MLTLIISGFELERAQAVRSTKELTGNDSIRRTRLGDGIGPRLMKFENFLTWW